MNNTLIKIKTFLEALGVVFHVIQRNLILIEKNTQILILSARAWKGEDTPHNIPDNILMALIVIEFDGDFHI